MKTEEIVLNAARNVTLTAYLQQTGGEFSSIPTRPSILVLPGGGYHMCSDREADPVALAYLKAGFHAFVLRYSVGEYAAWPHPLEDYEQAMELLRDRAEEWHLYPDKIAVIGFSAGGHLAASAAAFAKNKPDAAILGYSITEQKTATSYLKDAPDVVSRVDRNTCPCFVFATRTDNVVPVRNSIHMADALEKHGVPFELHIYAYGPHGFSTAESAVLLPGTEICARAAHWVGDSIAWLKDIWGDFGQGGLTEPKCKPEQNGDSAPYLSVDCTIGHLLSIPTAQGILAPVMVELQKALVAQYANGQAASDTDSSGTGGALDNIVLRMLLHAVKMPEEQIDSLNCKLSVIPNQSI